MDRARNKDLKVYVVSKNETHLLLIMISRSHYTSNKI